ncbi:MAG: cadherin-like beta sandwich domain-containing protein [Eubacterium sp.]|nr:cadherin-like beta sandwich domain-containing protein [Eubacterium sp.]
MKKRIIILIFMIASLTGSVCSAAAETSPAAGMISLSVSDNVIRAGDAFTVVCRVSSAAGVSEADFYVDYNTSVLEFVDGGAKAAKETGGVHITSLDNEDAPVRRTFSLQFIAKELGEATVFIRDGAHVTDGEGNPLSVSSERVELSVSVDGESPDAAASDGQDKPQEPKEKDTPEVSPSPVGDVSKLSGNNKVKEIITNAVILHPDFDPEVLTYDAEVDHDTDTFFIDYKLAGKNATAKIKGNKNLKFGDNKVRLIVTAENGEKRTYVFFVLRHTAGGGSDDENVSSGPAAALPADIPLDKEENKGYSIVLYMIIIVLVIISISLILALVRKRRELQSYYEEERKKISETKNDAGSRESSYEGGKVRSKDRESGDRY